MILSGQQETALKMIREWLEDKSKPFFDLGELLQNTEIH